MPLYTERQALEEIGDVDVEQVADLPESGCRHANPALLVLLDRPRRHIEHFGQGLLRQACRVASDPQFMAQRAVDMTGLASVDRLFVFPLHRRTFFKIGRTNGANPPTTISQKNRSPNRP